MEAAGAVVGRILRLVQAAGLQRDIWMNLERPSLLILVPLPVLALHPNSYNPDWLKSGNGYVLGQLSWCVRDGLTGRCRGLRLT